MVMSNKVKVVVGMSGGVDSSVAAALLVEQGYQVVGIMLRLWSEPGKEGSNRCCTPDSMAQARRVSSLIGIPFYTFDVKELFRKTVVDNFLNGYKSGVTPNPCLACNRSIRWGFLLNRAGMVGADFIATGHYARLLRTDDNKIKLLEGIDRRKDQSYVLSVLSRDQLSRTVFPLGDLKKEEVRHLAHQFNLPIADRAESQDLCFLGGEDYRLFMQTHNSDIIQPGPIIDTEGNTLGKHDGLVYYTIGQRKGIRIASPYPLYVIEKRLIDNCLVVGPAKELGYRRLITSEVNWIDVRPEESIFRTQVKTRYKAAKAWATVDQTLGNGLSILFDEPQRDLTAGQLAVLYNHENCLGSGLITKTYK
jgi:tRNA-uridine 2-sulfurtransferase